MSHRHCGECRLLILWPLLSCADGPLLWVKRVAGLGCSFLLFCCFFVNQAAETEANEGEWRMAAMNYANTRFSRLSK